MFLIMVIHSRFFENSIGPFPQRFEPLSVCTLVSRDEESSKLLLEVTPLGSGQSFYGSSEILLVMKKYSNF